MTVATVTDLFPERTKPQPVEPAGDEGPAWVLPPGAVPLDCVAFGEMHRTIARLTKRLDEVEGCLRQYEMRSARTANQ